MIFNPALNENTLKHTLIKFVTSFNLSQGVEQAEIDAWVDDLYRLGASGDYFFSSNEYIIVGWKP